MPLCPQHERGKPMKLGKSTATAAAVKTPTAQLSRTTFKTSRLLDFCSEKELTAQTGHERKDWPLVAFKELLDNALDACETVGATPKLTITVDASGITVADNGPGIPADTIAGILDYAVRVSSCEAYVSPTRGAQGNALKTILAMPFVLDGNHGQVEITANGQRDEITFTVDRIRQQPAITRTTHPVGNVKNETESKPDSACSPVTDTEPGFLQNVRTGSAVKVFWPNSACSTLTDAEARFLQLADDYVFLNPHCTLVVDWFGRRTTTEASDPTWKKWLPSDPTSPHWYAVEEFERLVAAYVAHDQDLGADRSVRELVKEFRGLTGTAKQKAVLEETDLSRVNLSHLANSHGLEHKIIGKLLATMKNHSKPVKPDALGAIGKQHIETRFAALGCEMESFQYKKVAQTGNDGLPTIIETAFAWRGDKCKEPRRIITGVNWSPGIVNPFRSLGSSYGDGLAALLEKRYAGRVEPIVFLLHCACPRVRYTDRGKSAVVVE
jgi:DNA topoisomerase VI subunit B